MIKQLSIFLLTTISFSLSSLAQNSILDIGLRLQKTPNLYYENGISIAYSNKNLKTDKLYFGLSYVTSRLGSAMGSNAIKQDNFIISSGYYFRKNHLIRPFLRANTGFFTANYCDKVFDDLPNSSLLLSSDAGLSFQTKQPLKIALSLGYNFITGDGIKGPGTLYPVFYQLNFSWNILQKRKTDEVKKEDSRTNN